MIVILEGCLELIWSTEDLVMSGKAYSGFPILLDDYMESCVPVNRFFHKYLLRGSIGSNRSWPNTGRALYDFFSYLQVHELDWCDVDRGEAKSLLAGYRDYCLETCKLSHNTTRQRLYYICEFYRFALENGWIKRLPYSYEERSVNRGSGFFSHIDASGGKYLANDMLPRPKKEMPRFLRLSEIKELLRVVDNPHHRIMIRLGLHTGLRREELASFPLAYVFDPSKKGAGGRNVHIKLDPFDGSGMVTKGSVAREILVSLRFMAELYRYATTIRGERASLSKTSHKTLLLNQHGEPYSDDGKSLCRIIGNAGKKLGIRAHTHMLRHTYATYTLISLRRIPQSRIEPLVFVQRQLGHSSIQTTMVYLHLINEIADDAVLAYDEELNELAEVA